MLYPYQTNRKPAFLFKHAFFNLFHEESDFKNTKTKQPYIEHIVVRSENKARNQSLSLGEKQALNLQRRKSSFIYNASKLN
jgi:hypothetical protein